MAQNEQFQNSSRDKRGARDGQAAKKRVARAHEAISGSEIRTKAGQVVAVLRVAMARPVAMEGPAVNGDFVAMADP